MICDATRYQLDHGGARRRMEENAEFSNVFIASGRYFS